MACSNFHVNSFSAASLNLHSHDNKCLRYCVWRPVFARGGKCMWRITEVLVIDGSLVQDVKPGHVEVVLLCICNGLRAHHGLGCCCSVDKLWSTVHHTNSITCSSIQDGDSNLIWKWLGFFMPKKGAVLPECIVLRGTVMSLSLMHAFHDFPVWKGLGFVYLCVGNSAGEEYFSY